MKRNNLLMLSFIVLMAVCAIVKSFWDYPMWPTIVAAITMASWVFAFADLFLSQSSAISKLAEEQLDGAEASLHEITRIKKAITVRITQLEEKAKDQPNSKASANLYTDQDELQHFQSANDHVLEMENDLQVYVKNLTSGKKHAKTLYRAGCVLTIVGFLSFFAIVIFKPLQDNPIGNTDGMTVWSFFVILLSQYLETWLDEQRTQKTNQMKKCVDGFDALRKSYEADVIHNQN